MTNEEFEKLQDQLEHYKLLRSTALDTIIILDPFIAGLEERLKKNK